MASAAATLHKILLVGDQETGKSSLILRIKDDTFSPDYIATIGVDFSIKHMENGARLQMWDSAGQGRFQSITSSYIKGSAMIIIVYDVTNEKSFENASQWVETIRQENGDAIIMLVGNKTDLEDRRVVTLQSGMEKAVALGVHHLETSAKLGENVAELLEKALSLLGQKVAVSKAQVPIVRLEIRELQYPLPEFCWCIL